MTIDLEKTYSISRVELVCHEWGTNWNMYAITVSGVTEDPATLKKFASRRHTGPGKLPPVPCGDFICLQRKITAN